MIRLWRFSHKRFCFDEVFKFFHLQKVEMSNIIKLQILQKYTDYN
jgi:hypothetical protein